MTNPSDPTQPAWGAPPPPAPRKSAGRRVGKPIAIGCGALLAIFIVLGIITALAGSNTNKTTSGAPATTAAATATAATSAPATAPPATEPPATRPATTAAPAKPKVLLSLTGTGLRKTASFTVKDQWHIRWANRGDFLAITVVDRAGQPVDIAANSQARETQIWPSDTGGTYRLEINATGGWAVEVVDDP
jgi:hypothetical protein